VAGLNEVKFVKSSDEIDDRATMHHAGKIERVPIGEPNTTVRLGLADFLRRRRASKSSVAASAVRLIQSAYLEEQCSAKSLLARPRPSARKCASMPALAKASPAAGKISLSAVTLADFVPFLVGELGPGLRHFNQQSFIGLVDGFSGQAKAFGRTPLVILEFGHRNPPPARQRDRRDLGSGQAKRMSWTIDLPAASGTIQSGADRVSLTRCPGAMKLRWQRSLAFVFRQTAAIAALLAFGGCSMVPSATERITDDSGGKIGSYLDKFDTLRKTRQQVVIDGTCASACTLVVNKIPRNRICVTPRAVLAFHAAWSPSLSGAELNTPGTRYLWSHYPADIRHWIARHGGLSPETINLSGRELAAMFPTCR
jgi:hypothetical protein